MPLSKLDPTERMRLMRFVCSFAWADMEITGEERTLIKKMVKALHLDAKEKAQVEGWLEVPPTPDEVDPTTVPRKHRELFLDAVKAIVVADGTVTAEERADLALFSELLK
ncbi:MAG TPA: TerB family tellurite resistance protein [Polyangia bacterium]|jgi:hypothetical protein